ncbi:helix-turn-helix domain-containing protein [Heyndrickxia sp. NPDC080065]|uniref:helix-turn-helix domain-containing protein n=1 Tax=Heyndrickxia sp. NPDC080065 TaxID=3390568 RepID=UPI003CFDC6DD
MNSEHIRITEEAIKYMRNHLSEDLTSEQLASSVGYSTYHFIRIFKDVTGISPRHYLSALRIEAGKDHLSHSPSSILKILLSIGFQSIGSFSTRFKQFVGQSPRDFRQKMNTLHQHFIQYQTKEISPFVEKNQTPSISFNIKTPSSFKGIIFAGLFPRPIPDQRPVVGTAFNHQKKMCTFSNVPKGDYYLLIAGIPWNSNPLKCFSSDRLLRGKYERVIQMKESTNEHVTIQLREPLPYDPPIVINLPLLLFEKNRAN